MSTRNDRFKHEFVVALRRARANDGCEVCFKVHDPAAPSCHNEECRVRWQKIRAIRALAPSPDQGEGT